MVPMIPPYIVSAGLQLNESQHLVKLQLRPLQMLNLRKFHRLGSPVAYTKKSPAKHLSAATQRAPQDPKNPRTPIPRIVPSRPLSDPAKHRQIRETSEPFLAGWHQISPILD